MSTLEHLLKNAKETLKNSGIQEYDVDAWYLFSHCFSMNRAEYVLSMHSHADEEKEKVFLQKIDIRKSRVPLQYIIKEQEFMGLTFKVNENVLIPRLDTEVLVEEILPYVEGREVLDMCTGSGCIAISIQKLGNPRQVTAVDISEEALEVAKENNDLLDGNVVFLHSDMFTQVSDKYDIIVSNPPYIDAKQLKELEPEVIEHEPVLALAGGEDGLEYYRILGKESGQYLNENGMLFLEIGYDQGESVSGILKEAGFTNVIVKQDLAGCDRVVIARKESICLIS